LHLRSGKCCRFAALRCCQLARIDGYDLPIHTVTLAVPADSTPSIVIEALQATEFAGELTPAAPELPPVLDWTPMPNVGPDETAQLPAAPAFILRAGVNKGQRFVVVAISPIFDRGGRRQSRQ
jgi:hypothetical protein